MIKLELREEAFHALMNAIRDANIYHGMLVSQCECAPTDSVQFRERIIATNSCLIAELTRQVNEQ